MNKSLKTQQKSQWTEQFFNKNNNVLHINYNGQGVIKSLEETYTEDRYVSTSAVERENAQKVKEKPCLIALDLEKELSVGSFHNLVN